MVLNIAHRGARSLAPENTLAAARKALEAGADMWETDLAISADEALVLFHDEALTRTTNAKSVFPARAPWKLVNFYLDDLQKLDCGSWFLESDPFGQIRAGRVSKEAKVSYQGARMPTLEEGLLFTQEAKWRINIELKQIPVELKGFPVVERVLALIDTLHFDCNHLVISSFNHVWLRNIQTLRTDIEVQALIGSSKIKPLDWGELEFKTYNARHTLLDHRIIGKLAEKGVAVNPWSVNEEKDMQRFINAGAAGIFTDFPQRLACILGRSTVA
jgi:glycerophosphoryl diester phosphodiesterase